MPLVRASEWTRVDDDEALAAPRLPGDARAGPVVRRAPPVPGVVGRGVGREQGPGRRGRALPARRVRLVRQESHEHALLLAPDGEDGVVSRVGREGMARAAGYGPRWVGREPRRHRARPRLPPAHGVAVGGAPLRILLKRKNYAEPILCVHSSSFPRTGQDRTNSAALRTCSGTRQDACRRYGVPT